MSPERQGRPATNRAASWVPVPVYKQNQFRKFYMPYFFRYENKLLKEAQDWCYLDLTEAGSTIIKSKTFLDSFFQCNASFLLTKLTLKVADFETKTMLCVSLLADHLVRSLHEITLNRIKLTFVKRK